MAEISVLLGSAQNRAVTEGSGASRTKFVSVAQPAQQLGIDIAGGRDLHFLVPAALRNLFTLDDPLVANGLGGLDGQQQMFFSWMYAGERRFARQMNGSFLDLLFE